jgi:rare lipoprotein A
MNNLKKFLLFLGLTVLSSCFSISYGQQKDKKIEKSITSKESNAKTKLTTKKDTVVTKEIIEDDNNVDSIKTDLNLNFKLYKKNAHASYYAQKFHGKRTASGAKFDNTKYTAAHKKLPFGTKVRVTNESNGKSVIVEITDRGPFSKAREIDLSKKAFMDITSNKNSGMVIVKLEVVN